MQKCSSSCSYANNNTFTDGTFLTKQDSSCGMKKADTLDTVIYVKTLHGQLMTHVFAKCVSCMQYKGHIILPYTMLPTVYDKGYTWNNFDIYIYIIPVLTS